MMEEKVRYFLLVKLMWSKTKYKTTINDDSSFLFPVLSFAEAKRLLVEFLILQIDEVLIL